MIIEEKADTPEDPPHVIPEVEKLPITDIIMAINGPCKYNTSSSTNRVNHVTTFKTAPNIFKMDAVEK